MLEPGVFERAEHFLAETTTAEEIPRETCNGARRSITGSIATSLVGQGIERRGVGVTKINASVRLTPAPFFHLRQPVAAVRFIRPPRNRNSSKFPRREPDN